MESKRDIAVVNSVLDYNKKQGTSPLKLQQLLYLIAEDYADKNDGASLLDEPFKKWKYGPAIPSVYGKFKKYGNKPITEFVEDEHGEFYIYKKNPKYKGRHAKNKEWNSITHICNKYKSKSAVELIKPIKDLSQKKEASDKSLDPSREASSETPRKKTDNIPFKIEESHEKNITLPITPEQLTKGALIDSTHPAMLSIIGYTIGYVADFIKLIEGFGSAAIWGAFISVVIVSGALVWLLFKVYLSVGALKDIFRTKKEEEEISESYKEWGGQP